MKDTNASLSKKLDSKYLTINKILNYGRFIMNSTKTNQDIDFSGTGKVYKLNQFVTSMKSVGFNLKSFFTNKKVIYFFVIMLGIIISTASTTFILERIVTSNENDSVILPKKFRTSIQHKINELKNSHNYYIKVATKEEFIVRWIWMFSNAKYKNDGNPKYGEYDCISAVVYYLWSWGSNIKLENIPSLNNRAELLSKLNQLDIRSSAKEVKPGDIVVFNPLKGIWHCGVVWNITDKGDVQYMDVNGRTGIGFGRYNFGNERIHKIYGVSYSLWVGDYLERLNK